jgi:hypothetical protein
MGPDEILLEGYAEMATYRSLMAYMSRKLIFFDTAGHWLTRFSQILVATPRTLSIWTV